MRCDEVRRRFDEMRRGDRRPPAGLVDHLSRCESCRDETAWGFGLVADLATIRSLEPPPGDVADRVMRAVAAERSRSPWPLPFAASVALLVLVAAAGGASAPGWIADAVRGTVRLASETAAALPTWLAATGALAGGMRSAFGALLPDPAWIETARPLVLSLGHVFVAAVLAASVLLAGREWFAARRPPGARS